MNIYNKVLSTLCVFLLACSSQLSASEAPANGSTISGEFELVNHLGVEVSQATFDGSYRLVFFGFTQCPDMCPTMMARITRVMNRLGEKSGRVVPLLISIDHEHDSIEVMAAYVDLFHPSIIGLTGSAQQIGTAAEGFNVTFGRSLDESGIANGSFYHSSYLYLMDEEGELLDVFGYGTSADIIFEQLNALLL